MHRIDGPGAAPGGLFTEGDPGAGVPATVVTDDWLNGVQEELASVAQANGDPLAKADNTQVLRAIRGLIDAALPAGIMAPYGGGAVPAGWLRCDGAAVSRVTYSRLFGAIGTTWGAGDGATTFNLPDSRGATLRDLDDGKGRDPGRVLGTFQDDQNRLHGHPYLSSTGNANTDAVGGIATDQQGTMTVQPAFTGVPADDNQTKLIGGSGGAEARMKNVAVRYLIRA